MILPYQTQPVMRTTSSGPAFPEGLLPQAQLPGKGNTKWQVKCFKGLITIKNPGGEAGGGNGFSLGYPCDDGGGPHPFKDPPHVSSKRLIT